MSIQEAHKQVRTTANKMGNMLRSRYGIWGLATISFIESALLVPIITDPFLIAYILANKKKTMHAIAATTVASVLGGLAAYFIAVGFYEVIVSPYIGAETQEHVQEIVHNFEEGAFILTLTGAVTPLPYTLVAIAAGLVQMPLILFILATLLGRSFRYAVEGVLVAEFGEPALRVVKKQIVATAVVFALLIVLYIVYKVL